MNTIPTYSEYLEEKGLIKSNDSKRNYRKFYQKLYMQNRRELKKEVTILFKKDNFALVKAQSIKHNMKPTSFIQKAVLAYLDKQYIVPKEKLIAELEQLLSLCYTEIVSIVDHFTRSNSEVLIRHILHIIERLEHQVTRVFRNPLSLEETIKATIKENPNYYQKLLSLLKNYDN